MKNEQTINLSDADKGKIKRLVVRYHQKGLDVGKAEELGVFRRMSYLLCAMHCLYTASYRIFGEVDNLIDMTGTKRLGIKKEIEEFNKAYDKFFRFFRDFQTLQGVREMNDETEYFYHQFMRWCQLPETWELGDEQLRPIETDPVIVIDGDDRNLNFHRTTVDREDLEEPEIQWCVTRYNRKTRKQETTGDEGHIDKSLAQMIAKRESANDPTHIYTAGQLITYHEKRIEIVPMKAYEGGDLVGDYRKLIKGTVSD